MVENEPFGRQPKPVTVVILGDRIDVQYWMSRLKTAAEGGYDVTTQSETNVFTIYPRAVND